MRRPGLARRVASPHYPADQEKIMPGRSWQVHLVGHDGVHLATNSVRFAHWVLARMLRTCDSTVRSDSTSRAAICRLDSASVSRAATSRSPLPS